MSLDLDEERSALLRDAAREAISLRRGAESLRRAEGVKVAEKLAKQGHRTSLKASPPLSEAAKASERTPGMALPANRYQDQQSLMANALHGPAPISIHVRVGDDATYAVAVRQADGVKAKALEAYRSVLRSELQR